LHLSDFYDKLNKINSGKEKRMAEKDIPDIVVGRLPRYLQALEHMLHRGHLATSSQELGDLIGISAAQIRKDLSQFGEFGKQGKGYSVAFLVEQLQKILKVNRFWDLALIGAGNLGHAIANYQGFSAHGFRIKLVFDADPLRIGTQMGHLTVLDAADIVPVIREHGIKIAMLTVPAYAAQSVTSDLIKAGINSILNYAPINLAVPEDVHVQYIDPIIYLQRMTYYQE
jgi:redox-sensing transcriptional repressor